jgi:hypothetical protein
LLAVLDLSDLHLPLFDSLQRRVPVLVDELAVHKETVCHCADGCDRGQVVVDRIQSDGEEIAGHRAGDIPVTFQPEEIGVEVMYFRIRGGSGDMMIQDQRQISALIQLGDQGCDSPCKIGEDDETPVLLVHFFQHCWIGLFQAETLDRISLSLERTCQDGARSDPIGIVVMKDLDCLFRPLPDLLDRPFHCVKPVVQHGSPLLIHSAHPI